MICKGCGADDELRMGYCFECASAGDVRLAKRKTWQHWLKGVSHLLRGYWWNAKTDFKCGWERIWRTGEYAPGREWENY